jgi:C4-dicarboxylate-binding protein DctP
MKTKIGHLIFGMLFAGIAFSLFCITGTLRAEVTDITFATWGTPKHYSTFTVNKWLEMVKAEGKDKINIKYFPNGQLYKGKALAKALPRGAVDMGQVLRAHLMGTIKICRGGYLPFLLKDVKHATWFHNQPEIREILDKAYEAQNMKVIWAGLIAPAGILNSKRPLVKPKDFKGLRLSTSGPVMGKLVASFGGKAQFVDYAELYMALNRGTIDGAWMVPGSVIGRKIYEVQKYMTICNANFVQMLYAMNLNKWKSLSKDVQDILLRTGRKAEEMNVKIVEKYSQAYVNKIKELGVNVYVLTPEERKVWMDIAIPTWNDWAKEMGPKGKRMIEIAESYQP